MKIALTFDIERDIPNLLDSYHGIEYGLPKLLEILDLYEIYGTFFCTANIALKDPESIKIIEQKGHEIACHSFNHERLSQLPIEKCQELISQTKKILENVCQKSKIIGFRAPYLDPPSYIFKLLKNLSFKYDSSISSYKKLVSYDINPSKIQEFIPLNISIRLPMSSYFLKKRIVNQNLSILFFHPWEAINIKELFNNQLNKVDLFKNRFFRPDRWKRTGNLFLNKFHNFIKEYKSRKAEFVTLKQLIIE